MRYNLLPAPLRHYANVAAENGARAITVSLDELDAIEASLIVSAGIVQDFTDDKYTAAMAAAEAEAAASQEGGWA